MWFLAAIALLVVAMAFELELLVYAIYSLLGVLLLSRFLAREWIENISATRECSRLTAQIGDTVAVIVEVKNEGNFPIPWLLLEDSLPRSALLQRPPRIKVKKRRLAIARLKSHGQMTMLYQVTFLMRGYYQLGPLLVESGDLFGLHRRYRTLTSPHFILVFPKIVQLEGYDLSSRRPIGEIRLTHRLFEDPTRISGVRPFQNGDPLSRIHWKATARTGDFYSKTYDASTVAGATLVLDFHRDNYSARAEPFRSELAVTAVASLANVVYQMGQQIGFVTNGRDAADRIREEGINHDFLSRETAQASTNMEEENTRLRPFEVETRRGADQLIRILETLARVEMTDGLTFPTLLTEVASRLPRDATIVAVLPHVTPETAIALGNLHRAGYAVTAVVVMYEDEKDYRDCLGRLIAERIDVRSIQDESTLSAVCAAQVLR